MKNITSANLMIRNTEQRVKCDDDDDDDDDDGDGNDSKPAVSRDGLTETNCISVDSVV
jgi:hypothetical protein